MALGQSCDYYCESDQRSYHAHPRNDVTVVAAGTYNIERQPVERCKEEIHQFIYNVARKRSRKTVIMCQLLQRYDKPESNVNIDVVNEFMANKVRKHQQWYLSKHNLSRDRVHINSCGSAKYARAIRHIIRNIIL